MLATAMFPARAGMSPDAESQALMLPDVPRVSGDEPGQPLTELLSSLCSPRERG